jgi:hypothetical protein
MGIYLENPQKSDGVDLMHAVVALAYCDRFLVRDGFVFQCFKQARRELSGIQANTLRERFRVLHERI